MAKRDDDCVSRNFRTAYKDYFQPCETYRCPQKPIKYPQRDPLLLTGHFRNNLLVNGRVPKSKIWPNSYVDVEEYKSFVEKLERCKKTIYGLVFQKSKINEEVIENMLRDLEKTIYQTSYSPNGYQTVSERRRVQRDPNGANMKYYETTYRTYYNRIEELERFKKYMMGLLRKEDNESIKNELRKLYLTGHTTYYDTICLPAVAIAKTKQVLETPIDIHSWRRV